MSSGRAMVIAPFDAAGQRIHDTVNRVLYELGFDVFRTDEQSSGSDRLLNILSGIETSNFVIIDVSRQNPLVIYELGFAHALRKSTLLLDSQENATTLPKELTELVSNPLSYDSNNLAALRDTLKSVIKSQWDI